METISPDLEAVAAALTRLRSATGAVARVQAVRAAARATQGLSSTDRQVLARGLIEHGAPAAGDLIVRSTGAGVPQEQLVSIAQGLLALDPGDAERLAAELRDPRLRGRVAAEPVGVAHDASARSAPPPIPAIARSTPRPSASPPVRAARPSDPSEDRAAGSHPEAAVDADEPRPAVRSPAAARSRLSDALRTASGARSRFALLEDLDTVCGTVGSSGAVVLLEAVPDGWQRRTVLRRLLDATAGGALAAEASALVTSFARPSDRFAAASLLQRHGSAEVERLEHLLGDRDAARLRSRATDRARRRDAASVTRTSSTTAGEVVRSAPHR